MISIQYEKGVPFIEVSKPDFSHADGGLLRGGHSNAGSPSFFRLNIRAELFVLRRCLDASL